MEHLPVHRLQLKVNVIDELFNSLDPAPFFTQELDPAAEQYIEKWASKFPARSQLHLSIHSKAAPSGGQHGSRVARAICHHFTFRAQATKRELKDLLRQGRLSMLIGCGFVVLCILLADLVRAQGSTSAHTILREGLTIVGWVALWRPIQIFLYDWWPILRRVQVLTNLARLRVELLVNDVSLSHDMADEDQPPVKA
jgi:hypothetical protein